MSTKQKRLVPKLDRRNAAKNIVYEACDDGSSQPICDQTSFRIHKGINVEFELICRSLGLSGPEDFAISAAAAYVHTLRFCVPASNKQVGEVCLKNNVVLAPPPVRSPAVVVDNFGSNWELIRGFATIDNHHQADTAREVSVSDSSNTAEVEYFVSPKGSLKYYTSIKNWQKGEFLGRGSYGTVYEAFTELKLPSSAAIHPVFHISQLKLSKGATPSIPLAQNRLPQFAMHHVPAVVLDRRLVNQGGRPKMMVLIQWSDGTPEEATWEAYEEMELKFSIETLM